METNKSKERVFISFYYALNRVLCDKSKFDVIEFF
jgi:hypothetical protein